MDISTNQNSAKKRSFNKTSEPPRQLANVLRTLHGMEAVAYRSGPSRYLVVAGLQWIILDCTLCYCYDNI